MMDKSNLMDYFSPSDWVRRPSLLAGAGMYLLAMIGLILSAIGLALLALFLPGISAQWQMLINSLVVEIGIIGLIPYIHMRRHPGVEKSYRFNRPNGVTILLVIGLAIVSAYFANVLTALWVMFIQSLGGTPRASGVPSPTNIGELMFAFLLVGVLPAVAEEFFFRGAVMSAWERRGKARALVVSSLLFALMHGSVSALPAHIAAGFVLGAVVLISDSIYTGMLYHFIYNSFMVWMSYQEVQLGNAVEPGSLMPNMLDSIGGAQGIALFIQMLVLSLTVCALLFLGLKKANAKKKKPGLEWRDRNKLGWREVVVLMAAMISVMALYGLDLLTIIPR